MDKYTAIIEYLGRNTSHVHYDEFSSTCLTEVERYVRRHTITEAVAELEFNDDSLTVDVAVVTMLHTRTVKGGTKTKTLFITRHKFD